MNATSPTEEERQSTDRAAAHAAFIWVNGPIIIGAGPSGLAVSACLSQNHGIPSVILERSDCIASLWQHWTYDRLRLHLPKQFCELPLLGFPEDFPRYPTKEQFVSYLESYAARFDIEPRFGHEVRNAEFDRVLSAWKVETGLATYVSRWLIVATGENAEPSGVDNFLGLGKFHGKVVHSSQYKSGREYVGQRVLVVGCGNSGMEVCLDLCRHNAHPHMVARNNVHVLPREMFGFSTFGVAATLLKWLPRSMVDKFLVMSATLTLGNTEELGLRRPKTGPIELKNVTGKTPVLDAGALSQIRSGKIKVMKGVKEITRTVAKFVDGQEKDFDSIILATGYKSNVPSWLKSEFFNKEGMPRTQFPDNWRGEDGLYTVGFARRGLLGVSSDAIKVAQDIAHHHHDRWTRTRTRTIHRGSDDCISSAFIK